VHNEYLHIVFEVHFDTTNFTFQLLRLHS